MNKYNLIIDLQQRYLISQITNQKNLINKLNSEIITLYCGFDPTSDSLHLGHLIPLICLKRFQLAGHRPIVLIGGATGLIGDPSFKITERPFNSLEIILKWAEKIKKQVATFLDLNNKNNGAIIIDNYHWFSSMNILDFLRNIGKNFSINTMINKECIKQRLKKNNTGISFTEFSYNLLQSYDFAYLCKHYDAILQIGGSDQWGNIISGINLIRRIYQKNVYGLTLPLITKSDNTKFGKTENATIWLDKNKTSPYTFYQFWINTDDKNVYKFLKFFTLLDMATINELELENKKSNNNIRHQKILAQEITRLVHGKQQLNIVERMTKNLFENKISQLTITDFLQLEYDGIPTIILFKKDKISLQEALVLTKFAPSKYQAGILIESNSILINGEKKTQEKKYIFQNKDILYNSYTLLRKGKKNFSLIHWK
ncbi:tyrosine--tRNA ligase [Blochmannia endosymbiont of Polyrhachis (Hedomyrma) turneri]|uniref:tyrosine--tRNA ligase n=1 Tax=Blochmannia endosymbiont of Polyrhachis (Hedomyrma) turneri TaxID=1505596 RepID=UPI00061A79DF|nr:tyrosine--tRNA ligase [Blochmannia endosymbiont of Polyrhachis (Hedomyrma) turneri]AKC59937.1 Tyrosine--tRNA ligase [Blochmannia endosymbiont of Polyrhachis (Hedomyrma) turneri]